MNVFYKRDFSFINIVNELVNGPLDIQIVLIWCWCSASKECFDRVSRALCRINNGGITKIMRKPYLHVN